MTIRPLVIVALAVASSLAFIPALAQSQFESSKLSPGIVVQGADVRSSKLSPGVVMQGVDLRSSKLSPGVIVQNSGFRSSKISVGIVVRTVFVGGGVIHAPLTHW